MKVLVYFENEKALRKSGIGRAMRHQMTSLSSANQEFTINPKDNLLPYTGQFIFFKKYGTAPI